MKITFNMATMPERSHVSLAAIDSIYDQADEIRIYLNNFKDVPAQFQRDKITCHIGEDLKSSGKLFWAQQPDQYYFCIDDDLIYPDTYCRDMLKKLDEYNNDAIVSLHGKVLKQGLKTSYFCQIVKNYHCLQDVDYDSPVHVIGNGVSVFNTNNINIDLKQFKYLYMDDITVSLQANNQNKKRVVMAHKRDYLKYNDPKVPTLHDKYKFNESTHVEVINSTTWVL